MFSLSQILNNLDNVAKESLQDEPKRSATSIRSRRRGNGGHDDDEDEDDDEDVDRVVTAIGARRDDDEENDEVHIGYQVSFSFSFSTFIKQARSPGTPSDSSKSII